MKTKKVVKKEKEVKIPTPEEMKAVREKVRLEKARAESIERADYMKYMQKVHLKIEKAVMAQCLKDEAFIGIPLPDVFKKFLKPDLEFMGFEWRDCEEKHSYGFFNIVFPREEEWPKRTSPQFSQHFTAAAVLAQRMRRISEEMKQMRQEIVKKMNNWDMDENSFLEISIKNFEGKKYVVPVMLKELADYKTLATDSAIFIEFESEEEEE